MIKKMTGKEMKKYASQMGLRMKDGKVTALLSSGKGDRIIAPLRSVDNIPDNAQGWFDPDTKRFDASTKKTTLVAHFVGGAKSEKEKHDSYSGTYAQFLKARRSSEPVDCGVPVTHSSCDSTPKRPSSYDGGGCGSSRSSFSSC